MTIGPPPMCTFCVHLTKFDLGGTSTCEAFPDGIPSGILRNEVDHRQPVDGDMGIRFEGNELFGEDGDARLDDLFDVEDEAVV